ncbi:zonular occludens toxin domain-containing protein [Methanorbis rubei]|uniref:Zona occludens toxin N-terminal domain-containing protein n=1 Tax=Methanorbis rubei TaxID=3028300 RepID=A0AAE4SBZ4_9EURY|nr:hypothetical protein [Methanocorpusculaceae archaeon Cs1]
MVSGQTGTVQYLSMIYIIVAPPRSGKTYYATKIAIENLIPQKSLIKSLFAKIKSGAVTLEDPNLTFTNYPVVDPKTGLSTYRWLSSYAKENIQDATIIIDEAWQDYSSRNYKEFTKDMQAFFAMNGHNNNDIYIIAQNAARVDVIIREMCNELYYVRKISIPFTERPLFFITYIYHDLDEMSRMTPDPYLAVKKRFVLFRSRIARAYDTHYFRSTKPPITPETWLEYHYKKTHLEPETNTEV